MTARVVLRMSSPDGRSVSVVTRSTFFTTPYSSMSWTTSLWTPPPAWPCACGSMASVIVTVSCTSSKTVFAHRAESGSADGSAVVTVRLYLPPGVISCDSLPPGLSGSWAVAGVLRVVVVVMTARVVLRMSSPDCCSSSSVAFDVFMNVPSGGSFPSFS